ncbi:TetR/AcrR family transcriptional regulator [bacterium]|nr:TetR/AcrR family transcriptional regulator [bacterium]
MEISEIRRALLNHALDLYSKQGIHDTTIKHVADAAGVEVGAAHSIFTDEDQLLDECLMEATEPIVSAISFAVEEETDPIAMIDKSMRLLDQFLVDRREIASIFFRAMSEGPDSMRKVMNRSFYPSGFFEQLAKMYEQGKIAIDPATLSFLLDSMVSVSHVNIDSIVQMYPSMDVDTFLELKHNSMLQMLRHGILPPKE